MIFLGLSDHPRIPSMKKFWHENVRPDISKEIVDRVISSKENTEMGEGGTTFHRLECKWIHFNWWYIS